MPLRAGVLNKETDRRSGRGQGQCGGPGTGRAAQGPPGPRPESRYAAGEIAARSRSAFRHPSSSPSVIGKAGSGGNGGETGGLFTVGKVNLI